MIIPAHACASRNQMKYYSTIDKEKNKALKQLKPKETMDWPKRLFFTMSK